MVAYTVVNGSDSQLANVDGSTDVEAYTYKDGITLDATQLAAVIQMGQKNVAVFADLTGDAAAAQKKRSAAIAAMYLSA